VGSAEERCAGERSHAVVGGGRRARLAGMAGTPPRPLTQPAPHKPHELAGRSRLHPCSGNSPLHDSIRSSRLWLKPSSIRHDSLKAARTPQGGAGALRSREANYYTAGSCPRHGRPTAGVAVLHLVGCPLLPSRLPGHIRTYRSSPGRSRGEYDCNVNQRKTLCRGPGS
jgi:hypothetical protein